MYQLTPEVLGIFARQHGMATHAQLSAAGMGRRARALAISLGIFEVLYHRTLHLVSSPLTLEARSAALCLAYPAGALTGPTGAQFAKVRRVPDDGKLHLAIPHGSHVGPFDDVVLHQTTKLPRSHVVRRRDGINVVSRARLAFDLAATLQPLDHQSVVADLRKKGVTRTELRRIAKELVHPGRAGSARFVDTLLRLEARSEESHGELVVADGLRRRGVPIEVQVRPHLKVGGVSIRMDLAVPSVRWGVEVDLHPDHLLLDGTTRDKQRDRACHRVDW
ncbi:MAG TPA: hypothetical protein DCR14_06385, partial [Acidimicrobiaceae bacterium]|nr:hypothetical protein [Acidimicrobiaceae bacterium]